MDNHIIWTILVEGKYYIVSSGYSGFEFGVKTLGDYLVTWDIPKSIEEEALEMEKTPWEFWESYYTGVTADHVYRVTDGLDLMPIESMEGIPRLFYEVPCLDLYRVYTVLARRWGSADGHTYLVGSSRTLAGATEMATKEEVLRGGKYKCEVIAGYLGSEAREILKRE